MTPLVEAALRSLLLAAAVAAGLGLLRIRNVVAQKLAWSLVLMAAFAMPAVLPLAARWHPLPAAVVPAHPLAALRRAFSPAKPSVSAPRYVPGELAAGPQIADAKASGCSSACEALSSDGRESTPASQMRVASATPASRPSAVVLARVDTPPPAIAHPRPAFTLPHLSLARIAIYLYAAVAALLLLRLAAGLYTALELLFSARPVPDIDLPAFASGLRLRASAEISAPVTVGSVILLPADFASWEPGKLSVVLAHERSHLRQGDFYLQLAASLYAALVWFSPLGWWLRDRLSDLAESISDRAGLAHAPSPSAYARLLLEFAASPRPTPIGVAMARPHRLTRRIENLLHESRFAQAFTGGRRSLAAVALVPLALLFATSFVRVQAAGQQAPPAPPASPVVVAPTPQPDPAPSPAAPLVSAPGEAPDPAPLAEPNAAPEPPEPPVQLDKSQTITVSGSAYSMSHSGGESYALITGDGGKKMQFSGDIHTSQIDKARKLAHGDFLWFTHGGKSYYIDDPATVARLRGTYKEMEVLGQAQADLGRHQSELGHQQEDFARSQEEFARKMATFKIDESQLKVTVPDLSKQKAELDAALTQLQPLVGKSVSREQLAHVQQQLAEMQARLSTMNAEFSAHVAEQVQRQLKNSDLQARMSLKQRELGELQGRLGAEQGRLGMRQGKLATDADQKVKGIIEQSLQNGSAHPID